MEVLTFRASYETEAHRLAIKGAVSVAEAKVLVARDLGLEKEFARTFDLELLLTTGDGQLEKLDDDNALIMPGSDLVVNRVLWGQVPDVVHSSSKAVGTWVKGEETRNVVPEGLRCARCRGLARSPLLARCSTRSCSNRSVCKLCAEVLVSQGIPAPCPACTNKSVTSFVPNRTLAAMVARLEAERSDISTFRSEGKNKKGTEAPTTGVRDVDASEMWLLFVQPQQLSLVHKDGYVVLPYKSTDALCQKVLSGEPRITLCVLSRGGGGTSIVSPGTAKVHRLWFCGSTASTAVPPPPLENKPSFRPLVDLWYRDVTGGRDASSGDFLLLELQWLSRFNSLVLLPGKAQPIAGILSSGATNEQPIPLAPLQKQAVVQRLNSEAHFARAPGTAPAPTGLANVLARLTKDAGTGDEKQREAIDQLWNALRNVWNNSQWARMLRVNCFLPWAATLPRLNEQQFLAVKNLQAQALRALDEKGIAGPLKVIEEYCGKPEPSDNFATSQHPPHDKDYLARESGGQNTTPSPATPGQLPRPYVATSTSSITPRTSWEPTATHLDRLPPSSGAGPTGDPRLHPHPDRPLAAPEGPESTDSPPPPSPMFPHPMPRRAAEGVQHRRSTIRGSVPDSPQEYAPRRGHRPGQSSHHGFSNSNHSAEWAPAEQNRTSYEYRPVRDAGRNGYRADDKPDGGPDDRLDGRSGSRTDGRQAIKPDSRPNLARGEGRGDGRSRQPSGRRSGQVPILARDDFMPRVSEQHGIREERRLDEPRTNARDANNEQYANNEHNANNERYVDEARSRMAPVLSPEDLRQALTHAVPRNRNEDDGYGGMDLRRTRSINGERSAPERIRGNERQARRPDGRRTEEARLGRRGEYSGLDSGSRRLEPLRPREERRQGGPRPDAGEGRRVDDRRVDDRRVDDERRVDDRRVDDERRVNDDRRVDDRRVDDRRGNGRRVDDRMVDNERREGRRLLDKMDSKFAEGRRAGRTLEESRVAQRRKRFAPGAEPSGVRRRVQLEENLPGEKVLDAEGARSSVGRSLDKKARVVECQADESSRAAAKIFSASLPKSKRPRNTLFS